MQATTVTRELIQSVGDHVYHQGTSYKPLSPTKGTRNAEIIYQAIKNMPDNAVVRADFNAFGKPYIFFPKREKKTNKETIGTINSRAERNELSNILHTIATSSAQQHPRSSTVHGSVLSLNLLARSIPIARDFVAGDLKKDLCLLAETHRKSPVPECMHRLWQSTARLEHEALKFSIIVCVNSATLILKCWEN